MKGIVGLVQLRKLPLSAKPVAALRIFRFLIHRKHDFIAFTWTA